MKADEKRRREEDVLKRQEERQHQEMMKTLGMDEFIKSVFDSQCLNKKSTFINSNGYKLA